MMASLGHPPNSTGIFGWSGTTDATTGLDTSLCRAAAGILEVGGSACGTTATVEAAAYMSVGTTFTLSSNACSATTLTGGATAGSVKSGTTGTCTFKVTMGNSATAPNGWACFANDLTTTTDTIKQTAASTTSATFSGSTTSADLINFGCIGY